MNDSKMLINFFPMKDDFESGYKFYLVYDILTLEIIHFQRQESTFWVPLPAFYSNYILKVPFPVLPMANPKLASLKNKQN